MNANNSRIVALLSAILFAAVLRLVPHPPNFTPIGAMALFSAAYFGRRPLAFAAPLGAMVLGDAVLGFYSGVWITYLAVALIVLVGWLALSKISVLRVGGAAIASSVVFFFVSNFGTWVFSAFLMRPRGKSVLPEYDRRRPLLRDLAVRRLPRCRAADTTAQGRAGTARLRLHF